MGSMKDKFSPSITNMIRMDHTHVMATFHQYEPGTAPKTKQALVNTICVALEIHTQLEEEIFYPALRAISKDRNTVDKAPAEHEQIRELIARLRAMQPTDSYYDQTVMQLMRIVMHHLADEETILLPEAEIYLADRLGELGMQMTRRRLQLAAPRAGEIAYNTMRGMPATSILVAAGAVLAGTYLFRRSNKLRWQA